MKNVILINILKQLDYKLKFKLFFKLVLTILGVNLFYIIAFAIFKSNNTSAFFIYNPFFSPFIHSGIEHLIYNIIFLAVVLTPDINSNLGMNNIIKLSLLLSFILLPFVLFEISDPIIGISGLCYLLLARILITRKKYYKLYILLLIFFCIFEFKSLGNKDGISHLCHLLGIVIGAVSIIFDRNIKKYLLV
jgi:membrane associated rhomboid family serine protease